jgi:arabinose-5-phosphate isomerase
MTHLTNSDFCALGRSVIETEAQAIANLSDRIDENFANACRILLACEGRIVVLGMGKSGHIGNKIAATLASTGSPAFFVHPSEASHGDLGMITSKDVALILSYSGETDEILTLLPFLKHLALPFIALTGNANSTLAKAATIHLNISVHKEACSLGLAPTSSTTATLAMGDALAVALLEARGFTPDDFAFAHPHGNLGKRLLLRIENLMRTGNAIPRVSCKTSLINSLMEMSQKKLGMTTIVNEADQVLGIFTDGDLRRAIDKGIDIQHTLIEEVMTHSPRTISDNMLAEEALYFMEQYKITVLLITDENKKIKGVLHMHDILHAGLQRSVHSVS